MVVFLVVRKNVRRGAEEFWRWMDGFRLLCLAIWREENPTVLMHNARSNHTLGEGTRVREEFGGRRGGCSSESVRTRITPFELN